MSSQEILTDTLRFNGKKCALVTEFGQKTLGPSNILASVTRYLRVYKSFLVSSFQRELEFRANFIAKIVMSCAWVAFTLITLFVLFSRTTTVAGWNRSQVLILTSTVFFMEALMRGLFMSLMEIPGMARLGTLDFVLTKPIDSQFWVSMRKFNLEQIGMLLVGFGILVYNIAASGSHSDPLSVLAYVVSVFCALAIYYSFALILMTLGIFFMRIDNMWVLSEMSLEIARYPLDIYASAVQRILIYIIPLGLLSTIPARQLLQGFQLGPLALSLGWACLAFWGSRAFWKYATRHYSSASS